MGMLGAKYTETKSSPRSTQGHGRQAALCNAPGDSNQNPAPWHPRLRCPAPEPWGDVLLLFPSHPGPLLQQPERLGQVSLCTPPTVLFLIEQPHAPTGRFQNPALTKCQEAPRAAAQRPDPRPAVPHTCSPSWPFSRKRCFLEPKRTSGGLGHLPFTTLGPTPSLKGYPGLDRTNPMLSGGFGSPSTRDAGS